MYADLSGLTAYATSRGESASAITLGVIEDVESRMAAYIVPQVVGEDAAEATVKAYCDAVYAQCLYESTETAKQVAAVVAAGVTSMTTSKFQFQVSGRRSDSLFPAGLCAVSRSHLRNADLLFRGVTTL